MAGCTSAACGSTSIGPANQLFLGLIQALATAQCDVSPPSMWLPDSGGEALKNGLDIYDFVVIGAGSAGAIVASRLSEIEEWNVLLIEAGGDPPMESVVPAFRANMLKSSVDWGFFAKSPNACQISTSGKGCYVSRGKMLGGSSSINFMLYIRGPPEDFNEWADLGNEGWSYNDLLPYFKEYEGNQNTSFVMYDDGQYHNATGPVQISSPVPSPQDQRIIQALKDYGVKWIADVNADETLGYFGFQTTAADGIRSSTAQAFLTSNMNRTNMHVIKNAYVNKVVLDENNVARGVEFTINGTHQMTVNVSKEVIVSAGTIQSPTLLMRSGVGPKEILEEHNIPSKVDLAVGEHLMDHVSTFIVFKSDIPSPVAPPTAQLSAWYEYLTERSGELSQTFLIGGLIDTTNGTSGLADMQFDMVTLPKGSPNATIEAIAKIAEFESQNELMIEINQNHVITYILTNAIKTKSIGSIKLNETLEADIDAAYLSDESDRDTLVRGIRAILDFLRSEPFQKIGAEAIHIPIQECDQLEDDSDDYWNCYVSYVSCPGLHQQGTCKMGSDSKAVVDSKLRVHNTTGLRVVDSSIMPTILRANTNAATMMIGEKGADLITKTYS